MNTRSKIRIYLVVMCLALGCASNTRAFSLLGPYESWMEETNGFRQPGLFIWPGEPISSEDIGGPMDITNEYRWNVPVITYGFDKSFLDYFGTNGVTAVQSAIQILNDLPPASQIVPTNYPFVSQANNYAATAQNLYDLKSETVSLLLEQLGLTQPTRNIFAIKQWNPILLSEPNSYQWFDGTIIPNYIVQRNFDPQTLEASPYIDSSLYVAYAFSDGTQNFIIPYAVNPSQQSFTAVADSFYEQGAGGFYTGLTRDDVGGLVYLLSTNNLNYENLLPSVYGNGTNSFVNGAWRPGVDKIIFVPQPVSQTGAFLVQTNLFTDRYLTNGYLAQQPLTRVIVQPDILFSVSDFGGQTGSPQVRRTSTTNWINNANLNGNPVGAGPGIIQPGIGIIFNKSGRTLEHDPSIADESVVDGTTLWGTFDGSTNPPIVYPITQAGTNQTIVRMWLMMGNYPFYTVSRHFEWSMNSTSGTQFVFQTSTNLVSWTTSFIVTNTGGVCTYCNYSPTSPSRFYRVVPQ